MSHRPYPQGGRRCAICRRHLTPEYISIRLQTRGRTGSGPGLEEWCRRCFDAAREAAVKVLAPRPRLPRRRWPKRLDAQIELRLPRDEALELDRIKRQIIARAAFLERVDWSVSISEDAPKALAMAEA